MEEHWLWYLTGTVDSISTITVTVQKDNRRDFKYVLSPRIYITRPSEVESILGMIDKYCDNRNIIYRVDDSESSSRIVIEGVNNIQKFLDPIVDGFIQQQGRAKYFLNRVLPELKGGSPKSKKKFIEAMEVVDELREYPMRSRKSSKYDSDYFQEEWDL